MLDRPIAWLCIAIPKVWRADLYIRMQSAHVQQFTQPHAHGSEYTVPTLCLFGFSHSCRLQWMHVYHCCSTTPDKPNETDLWMINVATFIKSMPINQVLSKPCSGSCMPNASVWAPSLEEAASNCQFPLGALPPWLKARDYMLTIINANFQRQPSG